MAMERWDPARVKDRVYKCVVHRVVDLKKEQKDGGTRSIVVAREHLRPTFGMMEHEKISALVLFVEVVYGVEVYERSIP